MAFILQLVRKSTAVELHDFFGYLGRAPVTKSAFAQRRRAIRPAFFRDFFYRSVADFYTCFRHARRWRSFLLFAVDGTGQTLPREDWIGRAFGFHRNQHDNVPSTRSILLTYDLLNRMASPRGPIPLLRSAPACTPRRAGRSATPAEDFPKVGQFKVNQFALVDSEQTPWAVGLRCRCAGDDG